MFESVGRLLQRIVILLGHWATVASIFVQHLINRDGSAAIEVERRDSSRVSISRLRSYNVQHDADRDHLEPQTVLFRPSSRCRQPDGQSQSEQTSLNRPGSEHLVDAHRLKVQERFRLFPSKPDEYPPTSHLEDGPVIARLNSRSISYYVTSKAFIKREPHPDELGDDIYGRPVVNPYIQNRLRNEAAALRLIAERTTIPVPKVLGLWEENGLVHLKTALTNGAVELEDVDTDKHSKAIERITSQLEEDVLPHLRLLRRNTLGSADADLPVIPPRWL